MTKDNAYIYQKFVTSVWLSEKWKSGVSGRQKKQQQQQQRRRETTQTKERGLLNPVAPHW